MPFMSEVTALRRWRGTGFAGRRGGIGGGGRVGALDQVGLGSLGQVNRRLRQRKEGFGQADQVRDLRGGRSLHDRLRIGQADIFGGEDAQPSCDEDRVGAAFDHPRQPVQGGVCVGVSHGLDQGRDQVVVVFSLPVVGEPCAAQRLDQRLFGDRAACRRRAGVVAATASSSVERATRASPPDQRASCRYELGIELADSDAASPRSGSASARCRIVAMASSERGCSTATRHRERRAALTSNDGFSVVAPIKRDRAVLDGAQECVLLRLVEAMDLVDEEDGPVGRGAGFCGLPRWRRGTSFTPARTAESAMNSAPVVRGDQAGESRLARAGRAPEDQRGELALCAAAPTQERLLAGQVGLADEVFEAARPHPLGQRCVGCAGAGFEVIGQVEETLGLVFGHGVSSEGRLG